MAEIDSNGRANDGDHETPLRDNRKENGRHSSNDDDVENTEAKSEDAKQSLIASPGGRMSSNPVVVLIEADDEATDLLGDNEVNGMLSEPPASSTPEAPEKVEHSESDQVDTISRQTSLSNQTSFAKGRKRRRNVAQVADDAQNRTLLPPNQYETMLRRRAVCKPEEERENGVDGSPASSVRSIPLFGTNSRDEQDGDDSDSDALEGYDEEYGDISVGMKLNIIGGKVIVQRINTLADGRASPAQLTGLVQRGDVLLSIDNVSLVNLPLDQLLNGLKPLSAPHHGNHYKRSLHLRFAAGEGLKLLEKNESKKANADPTFALSQYVTFVDQLSGVPMFEPEIISTESRESPETIVPATPVKAISPPSLPQSGMSSDDQISVHIAEFRKVEQQKYMSEYFMDNDAFSDILRASAMLLSHEYAKGQTPLTFSEMMENGERAMGGAKALFLNMEDVDKGNDTRSFKKWNSTLSLRSRANARRRYVMKNVIQHEEPVEEEPSDLESSVGSSISGDVEEPTGDELLLQLAAQDEIWRQNVVEVLQNAAEELEEDETSKQQDSDESREDDRNGATNGLPKSLESLLFGSKVSTMLASEKQSNALPPEDVTSVLFDLVTNLTVTPDEISLNDSNHHIRLKSNTMMVPFHERHTKKNTYAMFAAQFLVSEALPVWLKSFRPLPWDQRRIMWPKTDGAPGTSLASASYDISNDDLTQDSGSTGYKSPGMLYRKGLRQQIEDLELNAETRAETCFLVTFYFTQELLPSLAIPNGKGTDAGHQTKDAVEFVKTYGAYLNLHQSLVSAVAVKADSVIETLLALAKHDPRHREVSKELSKSSGLVLYDQTMLSAVILRLKGVRKEPKSDRRGDLMNICVLAYPDLLPWQVRRACLGNDVATIDRDSLEYYGVYYEYLSLLLHPSEGHDAARQDAELVTEWCRLSLEMPAQLEGGDSEVGGKERQKSNFVAVASRSSSEHSFYRRDLFALMNLSVQCDEYNLALDLVDEMLESPTCCNDKEVMLATLDVMRQIATGALNLESSSNSDMDEVLLRKIFGLFEKIATGKSEVCRESIDVSNELYSLLQSCQNSEPGASEAELSFVNLLAHHVTPKYALETLARWAPDYPSEYVIPLLHILLQRGTHDGIRSEISGTLLRIRHARGQWQGQDGASIPPADSGRNIWRRMFDGNVAITK